MSRNLARCAVVLFAFLLAGCAPQRSAVVHKPVAAPINSKIVERAMQPYRRHILSISAHGTDLVLAVDDQRWDQMDSDLQDRILGAAIGAWKEQWRHAHPGVHRELHVYVNGYFADRLGSMTSNV